MADTRTQTKRREIMQAVKTRDTGPELIVRRMLFSAGYRYRIHAAGLPGKPDISIKKSKKAIFIHGCFWHAHGCPKGQPPKSKEEYWLPKLRANVERDMRKQKELSALGWKILVIWQCETKDSPKLKERLLSFMHSH